MAINFVPLDKEKHKDLKVAVNTSFSFAKNTHLAAATIREFAQLAATMPLVFIEDTNAKRQLGSSKVQDYHFSVRSVIFRKIATPVKLICWVSDPP